MKNKKRQFFYTLLLIINIIFFIAAFCINKYTQCNKKESFKYEVVGYSYDAAAYKKSAKRYLFLRNELGSFTFEVSPQTYYDAEHGQKTIWFTDSPHSLEYNANNKQTKENIKKYFVDDKKILTNFEYEYCNTFACIGILLYLAVLILAITNICCMIGYNEGECERDKLYLNWYDKLVGTMSYSFMIYQFFSSL